MLGLESEAKLQTRLICLVILESEVVLLWLRVGLLGIVCAFRELDG
jgi:hypothetical protein